MVFAPEFRNPIPNQPKRCDYVTHGDEGDDSKRMVSRIPSGALFVVKKYHLAAVFGKSLAHQKQGCDDYLLRVKQSRNK